MPAGELLTVPPIPELTVRPNCSIVNVAVTDLGPSTVMFAVPVPVASPLQPVKSEWAAGVAVKVTLAPFSKLLKQFAPQLIPAGLLTTVPVPLPSLETVKPAEERKFAHALAEDAGVPSGPNVAPEAGW